MTYNSFLYSIGHGQKSQEEFLSELKSFNINFLVDVRTSPYSKWAPQYNQGIIESWLADNGIRYIYMGNSIGGRPQNDDCYDEEGYFDYRRMAQEPKFIMGLQRLIEANKKNCRVAIMCSESDPSECHRSKLIGRELYFEHNIAMTHIIGVNKSIKQETIMNTLTKGEWPNGNLFEPSVPPFFKSRKPYKHTEEVIEESFYHYD